MVRAFTAYIDFCYLVRRNVISEDTLNEIDDALARFHQYRTIFEETGVRNSTPRAQAFSLPRQHAMVHYRAHIENFGAPNGLCSSITESKHIVAVKRTWRRTGKYEALHQMLVINERNDKLAAADLDFRSRGMLIGSCLEGTLKGLAEGVGDESDSDEDRSDSDEGEDSNLRLEDFDAAPEMGTSRNIDEGPGEDTQMGTSGGEGDGAECGPVDGDTLYNEVFLACKKGVSSLSLFKKITEITR